MNRSEFWASVAVGNTGECWSWQRATHPRSGHGRARWFGVVMGAHRIAWLTSRGPIPVGLFVCHKCDNPPCCNVDHLFLGSHADNMTDAAMKGRMAGNSGRSGAANGRALFTADQVRAIRAASGTQSEIARTFGTSQPVISKIRRHESYVDVT